MQKYKRIYIFLLLAVSLNATILTYKSCAEVVNFILAKLTQENGNQKNNHIITLRDVKIEYEIQIPDSQNLSDYLDAAIKIEAASWKGDKGSALQIQPNLSYFFITYLQDASREGIVRLAFLQIENRRVAMLIALIGLDRGLIGQDVYVAIILMSLLTTILTPIVLRNWLYRSQKQSRGSGRQKTRDE